MPSVISRLSKNAVSLMIAGLIDKATYVFFFAYIARKLSQADFGAYSLTLTLIFLGGLLSNFGIEYVIIREAAKNRERSGAFFNNAVLITLILSLLAWPLVTGLAILLNYDANVIFLISFGGAVFIFIGIGQTASAVIKAYERMEIFSFVSSLYSIVGLGIGISALWMGGSITSLVVVLMITEAMKAMTLCLIVHRYFTPIKWQFDKAVITLILKQTVPFALLMAYGIILRRTDLLLMGMLKPLDDVAIYAAAAKFVDFFSLFSGSIILALFPALSAKLNSSRQESWRLYNDSIGVFAILGFGVTLSVMVMAQPIILIVYGKTYLAGSTVLRWLGLAFLFTVLSGPAGIILLAAGDQMHRLLAMCGIVLAINVLLNLWLIPIYSYNGAAMATFVCSIIGFAGRLILSRTYFNRLANIFRLSWRALLASSFMALVLILLKNLNVFILIVIGISSYGIFLTALGEFRMEQYASIRTKLSKLLQTMN